MKSYKDVVNEVNESVKPSVEKIEAILNNAKIPYKKVNKDGTEYEIVSGAKNKTGLKWADYEESVYDALLKAKISLIDNSVFVV